MAVRIVQEAGNEGVNFHCDSTGSVHACVLPSVIRGNNSPSLHLQGLGEGGKMCPGRLEILEGDFFSCILEREAGVRADRCVISQRELFS